MESKFPTTTWTLVRSAGDRNDSESASALATLCERYWYPIYAYIRRCGYPAEQSQDLTQDFFARLLEKRYIERADQDRGRFRSFLLSSVKNFLSDEADRRNARKRGGNALPPLPFEVESGEERYRLEPFHSDTPERIFERRWALALLERVVYRLQQEFVQSGREAHFDRLKTFLMSQRSEVPYAQLAHDLGVTENALRVAVHRFRKRYRDLLRAEIGETVSTSEEIDEEIRHLLRCVRVTELNV